MKLSSPNWAFVHMDTDHFKNHPVIQAWVWFWRLSPWISPRPTESWLPIEVHWLPTTQRFPAVDTNTQIATNIFHILASTHTQGAHHPDEHKAYYCVIHGRCHQRPGPAQPPPRLPSTHIHLPRHQVQCHPLPPNSNSLSYIFSRINVTFIFSRIDVTFPQPPPTHSTYNLCHLGRAGIVVVLSLLRLRTERCKRPNVERLNFFESATF